MRLAALRVHVALSLAYRVTLATISSNMGAAQSTSSTLPRKPVAPVSATSLLEKQLSSLAVRHDDKARAIQHGSGSATVTLDDIDVYEKQYQSEPARKALGTILRFVIAPIGLPIPGQGAYLSNSSTS
jgi:hypothetical protein